MLHHLLQNMNCILQKLRIENKKMFEIFTCPVFLNLATINPSIADARFAELNTIKGALPPSSKPILFTPEEHCLYNNFPTAVDPEK